MEKIIACVSTPIGKGAISIIRMSGKNCLQLAEKFFYAKSLDYQKITPRVLYLGYFRLDQMQREKCLMVYFKEPNSYTGEDMVEFQIHGGTVITQKVLEVLLNNGAALAQPGQLSRLAFENGKISLDEAEAIIDEINAESESELQASLSVGGGKLKNQIKMLQSALTETLAEIEATLDYPEEDFEKSVQEKIYKHVMYVSNKIESILKDSEKVKYISDGISVAIIGAPNVGKSSLLNALLGEERAIVTDIAGTTRDIIKDHLFFKGIKINLIDTAGIRTSQDKVESIGIEKSKESVQQSDIVLFVLDGSRTISEEDIEIEKLIGNKTHIKLINKCDQKRVLPKQTNELEISAITNKNVDQALNMIYDMILQEDIDFNKLIITNQRQIEILKNAQQLVTEILLKNYESMDILSMLIHKLWNELGKITGESENEKIIDLIFSKFCLGK